MQGRQRGLSQEGAAAKADVSVRSGRRIENGEIRRAMERHWRTREDPLINVWESKLVPLLEREPSLTGLTLLEHLEDNYPGRYGNEVLRTLQRRVKLWLALHGPERSVIFRQHAEPGRQGLSDFSVPNTSITINDEPFAHRFYQFRLASSGWRSVMIVQGGESYTALAEGLQRALSQLGGSPAEHRTDSLSAAFNNQREYWQDRYESLCRHYGMEPTRNNPGISHENGAIETAHGSFKRRLSQALKLRGQTDFATIAEYQQVIDKVVKRLNRRVSKRLRAELPKLSALPRYRFADYTDVVVRVTGSATIEVRRVLYTVPSRLKGERLRIHLYHDRLRCYLGSTYVITLTRKYPKTAGGRTRQVDYRHVIHALSAKPQAFRYSQIRDDLLPTPVYRELWMHADKQFDARTACKWIVAVLRFASDYDCETELGSYLEAARIKGQLPNLKELQKEFLSDMAEQRVVVQSVTSNQHCLADYDELLAVDEVAHV